MLMSKVLFITQPQIGHLNTLLTIALQMKEDGHQPSFLVPGVKGIGSDSRIEILKTAALIPELIEKNGLPVEMVKPSLVGALLATLLPFASRYNEFMLVVELSSIGIEQYTRSIISHIEQSKPDIVVTDFTLYSAYIAAERAGIPCVTVYHTGLPFKGKLVPPFGSGLPIGESAPVSGRQFYRREHFILSRLDNRINRARRKVDLAAIAPDLLCRPYSHWLNLVASAEIIEAPRDNLTDTTFFIGPCFTNRKALSNDFPFHQLRQDKYKVYVSLGTVFNNKPQVFRKIMRALNHPDYQIIISAGGAFPKLINSAIPENVLLFPSVPQVELLSQVDLVIGHGGNNSTNETLAAGKPLIVMPIGGEQGDNASRVEYLRAGLRINIDHFDERELATKVNAIRTNPEYQKRVLELKEGLGKTDGARTASELIQWVAQKRKPLTRPKGFPLTIRIDNIAQFWHSISKMV
jgi:MGT family glycosyltransferase